MSVFITAYLRIVSKGVSLGLVVVGMRRLEEVTTAGR
jgi:hypothetical protein